MYRAVHHECILWWRKHGEIHLCLFLVQGDQCVLTDPRRWDLLRCIYQCAKRNPNLASKLIWIPQISLRVLKGKVFSEAQLPVVLPLVFFLCSRVSCVFFYSDVLYRRLLLCPVLMVFYKSCIRSGKLASKILKVVKSGRFLGKRGGSRRKRGGSFAFLWCR